MQIYWIAALGFGIVIALFAAQNSTPIPIRFLWLGIDDVPISVLVLVCALLGALVTFLFGLGREIRGRLARRSIRRTSRSQEQSIAELETRIQQLETEKAELRGALEALQANAAGASERGAIEGQAIAAEPLPLNPGQEPSRRPEP